MLVGSFDTAKRVFLIAEAGVNHEGSLETAKRMVEEAAKAGADAIKFQTYKTEQLLMAQEEERVAQRKGREFSQSQFRELAEHCRRWNILFLSTPFDEDSVRLLDQLAPAFKISSLDFTNYQLIKCALHYHKPLIMSCGMSDDLTVRRTLAFLKTWAGEEFVKRSVTLLHCVSSYPAPYEEINLRAIPYLAERYQVEVGYSDHGVSINMCLAAASLGARIIEKHFTLDKNTVGMRDHKLSADPVDLRQLVQGIRQIEVALGVKGKGIAKVERDNLYLMRRGLVAAANLEEGSVLTKDAVRLLLPGEGVPGERYFAALGKTLRRAVQEGEAIRPEDIVWR